MILVPVCWAACVPDEPCMYVYMYVMFSVGAGRGSVGCRMDDEAGWGCLCYYVCLCCVRLRAGLPRNGRIAR
jgi:hypothetical protein